NPYQGYQSSSSPASMITSSPTSILPFNFTTFSGEQYPSLLSALYISNLLPPIMMDSYAPVTVHTSPALNPCKVGSSVESNLTISPSSIASSSSSTITSYSLCNTYAFIPLASTVTPSESLLASWTTVSMSPLSDRKSVV